MTLEELTVIVKCVGVGGSILWGGTVAIVAALWQRVRQQDKRISKLQGQASEGNAIRELVSGCTVLGCPIRAMVSNMAPLALFCFYFA